MERILKLLLGIHIPTNALPKVSKGADFAESQSKKSGHCKWIHHERTYSNPTDMATFMAVSRNRKGENLKKYFGSLFLLPVEVDGYSAYPGHFLIIQWCWAHILREAENVAISCGADSMAESLHQVLLGLFREAKRIAVVTVDSEGADAQMCIDLKNRVLAVPDMCGDRPFGGTLRNAAPNLFAFLQYLGMPPTNKPPRAAYAMAPCWSARYSRNW